MEHLEASRDAHAAIGTCWDVITDPAYTCAWLTVADDVTPVGEPGLGQRLRSTATVLGHTVRADQTVETWEPPNRYAFAGTEPTDIAFRFTLAEADLGTTITLRVEADVRGVPKLAKRVATRALRGQLTRSLQQLVRVVEVEQARR